MRCRSRFVARRLRRPRTKMASRASASTSLTSAFTSLGQRRSRPRPPVAFRPPLRTSLPRITRAPDSSRRARRSLASRSCRPSSSRRGVKSSRTRRASGPARRGAAASPAAGGAWGQREHSRCILPPLRSSLRAPRRTPARPRLRQARSTCSQLRRRGRQWLSVRPTR